MIKGEKEEKREESGGLATTYCHNWEVKGKKRGGKVLTEW